MTVDAGATLAGHGTIGGNVANGSPIGETPPLLIYADQPKVSGSN